MADKKKRPLDDDGKPASPRRDAEYREIRGRLSAGDDHGPVSLDGGKFYDENRKLSPEEVKAGWENEAKYPGPPKPGESFAPPRLGGPPIPAGEAANQPVHQEGGLIEAILHGLGLGKRR